ncbi:MAG: hypothetical protein V4489_02955 [Chlamydiota bacterium]
MKSTIVDKLQNVGCTVEYTLVKEGPHSPYHPGMTDALIKATDSFADTGHF